MLNRLKQPIGRWFAGTLILALISLTANGILSWRLLAERQINSTLLAAKDTDLVVANLENRDLEVKNKTITESLAAKDQELNKKTIELDNLSKDLDAKKKELESKVADLAAATKQAADQKSQLEASSSELSKLRDRPPLFSFQAEQCGLADLEAKKSAVKEVVTAAFDQISSLYGKPYALHSITIKFACALSNDKASGEIKIENSDKGLDLEIRIKDFDKNSFTDVNTIIHETIHSFHGLSILSPTAFEEGITVAAADAVMNKLITAGSIPKFSPLYIRISETEYASKLTSLPIPRDGSAFYGSAQVTDYYQIVGKAWYKLYQSDPDFFKKFNEKIYSAKNSGQEITESMVLSTIRQVAPNAQLTGSAWQLN